MNSCMSNGRSARLLPAHQRCVAGMGVHPPEAFKHSPLFHAEHVYEVSLFSDISDGHFSHLQKFLPFTTRFYLFFLFSQHFYIPLFPPLSPPGKTNTLCPCMLYTKNFSPLKLLFPH